MILGETARRIGGFFAALVQARTLSVPCLRDTLGKRRQ